MEPGGKRQIGGGRGKAGRDPSAGAGEQRQKRRPRLSPSSEVGRGAQVVSDAPARPQAARSARRGRCGAVGLAHAGPGPLRWAKYSHPPQGLCRRKAGTASPSRVRPQAQALALGPFALPSLAPTQSRAPASSWQPRGKRVPRRALWRRGAGTRRRPRARRLPQSPAQMAEAASQPHRPHFLFGFF